MHPKNPTPATTPSALKTASDDFVKELREAADDVAAYERVKVAHVTRALLGLQKLRTLMGSALNPQEGPR